MTNALNKCIKQSIISGCIWTLSNSYWWTPKVKWTEMDCQWVKPLNTQGFRFHRWLWRVEGWHLESISMLRKKMICIPIHYAHKRQIRLWCIQTETGNTFNPMLNTLNAPEESFRPCPNGQKLSFPLCFPLMHFRNISVKTDSLRKRIEL